jgi:acyl-CoA synthetase (AMP-forming)/AMP-acid ligase II
VTAAHQTGQTLVEVLRRQAIDKASAPAVTFLNGSAGVAEPRSFAALDRRARRLAARLQDHVPCLGERALVLLQPGLGFIEAFLGCLYAGVVAVPLTMPRPNRPLIRLTRIALDARPRFVFATADQQAWLASQAEAAAWLAQVIWLSPEHDDAAVTDWRSPDIDGDSLAFLQYTSGSTRAPRGVMVRHRNILANLALIAEAFGDPEARPIVSWLPPYHDMGLIGTILAPLYTGQRAILMSPLHFLQRPLRWLEAISRYRAATSGGPTFAYDLCVRRIPREQRRDLDLSCWATAFIGSEPVRAEVLDAFAEAFAEAGFHRRAFSPCYGLAEATLLVTGQARTRPPAVTAFEVAALGAGQAKPGGASQSPVRRLVGCGRRWGGLRLAIVDPETRRRCAPGEIGEIWIDHASVPGRYWRQPEASRETFAVPLVGEAPSRYLRSGDLGFLYDGQLYVTGRRKNLIIIDGRNHHPHDIEASVEGCHSALRVGGCAVFAVTGAGGERLVVVAEIDARRNGNGSGEDAAETHAAVLRAIRGAVAADHDLAVDTIVLTPAGAVPKTTSGKLRRFECRARFLNERLEVLASWSLPRPSEAGRSCTHAGAAP